MTRGQSRLNEVGRARIAGEGRLRDCEGVRHPPSPDDLHCLILKDFLDSTICDLMCEAFRDLSRRIHNHVPGFWDGRFIWHSDVSKAYGELAHQMLSAQRRAATLITEFYGLAQPIYPDLLQIMSWPVGIHMPPMPTMPIPTARCTPWRTATSPVSSTSMTITGEASSISPLWIR
jgi:hypothetical protein